MLRLQLLCTELEDAARYGSVTKAERVIKNADSMSISSGLYLSSEDSVDSQDKAENLVIIGSRVFEIAAKRLGFNLKSRVVESQEGYCRQVYLQ